MAPRTQADGGVTWHMTASPDGDLTDASGRNYPSLFWEGRSPPPSLRTRASSSRRKQPLRSSRQARRPGAEWARGDWVHHLLGTADRWAGQGTGHLRHRWVRSQGRLPLHNPFLRRRDRPGGIHPGLHRRRGCTASIGSWAEACACTRTDRIHRRRVGRNRAV